MKTDTDEIIEIGDSRIIDGSEITRKLNAFRDTLRKDDPKNDLLNFLDSSFHLFSMGNKYEPFMFAMDSIKAVYEAAARASTDCDWFYTLGLRALIPELARVVAPKGHEDYYYVCANEVVEENFEDDLFATSENLQELLARR